MRNTRQNLILHASNFQMYYKSKFQRMKHVGEQK